MSVYAGYVRVSRVGDRSETLRSPTDQEKAIRKWAKDHGHRIVMLEHELDQSGGRDDRPILSDAIGAIERGELDGLAVYNFARMTRSLRHSLEVRERVKDAEGQIVSISQPVDETTWQGRQTANIMASLDQAERERQAETFEVAKAEAIRDGIYIAGRVPLGYTKNDQRKLEPDSATAPLVRRAFEMRAAGASWQKIADMLAEGLGRPMFGPTVARMIENPAYLGVARQGKNENPHAHTAIVDRALWDAAQRPMSRPPRGKHETALLAGIVRCAGCSRRMTSTIAKGRREYRCRRHGAGGECPEPAIVIGPIIEPIVERTVLDHIEEMAVTATERNRAIEEAGRALAEAEAELRAYQDATKAIDDPQAFAHGAKSRHEAVEAARARLAEARIEAPDVPDPTTVRELWPTMSAAERNRVLRGALDVVWVRRGRGADDRVRMVAHGHGPADLSVQGKRFKIRPLDWSADLPGEIRPTSP